MDQWVCGPLLAYPYMLECAGSGFIHLIVYLLNTYFVPSPVLSIGAQW